MSRIYSDEKPELLAPAGSWEALNAAVQAGADAVYFGVDQLNMRARAVRPFTVPDLKKITTLCRKRGIKSVLALNTLIYDSEIEEVHRICKAASKAGISSIIATDIAAIEIARSLGLEVHISTQANVTNTQTVRFFAKYADVVVLARELSLEQIRSIHRCILDEPILGPGGKPVRIELFIHGALCIAVSGKCAMSLSLTGHSANRGDCFQICRRTYRVIDRETGQEMELDNPFIMSPRDLCTIGIIDRLIESGARVLKIEGRGRPADYVYHATRVYRQAIDSVLENHYTPDKITAWKEELHSVFNRGFWEDGYYLGKRIPEWSGAYGSQAEKQKTMVGKVVNYYRKRGIAHIKVLNGTVSLNEILAVTGPTTGYLEFTLSNLMAEDRPAESASAGLEITIPVPEKVRPNDRVYVIRNRTDWQS
jgi:putative protease